MKEKKIKSERIFKGRLLGLRDDTVQLPNGKTSKREVVEHPGAVAIVAVTQDKELVLVRQWRQATGQLLLEVPAGVPRKGEKGEAAAKRELEEETGFSAKNVRKVWQGYASPGYSDELIQFFLATDMVKARSNPDEDEFVEVDIIDVETLMDMLLNGKICDNKTMIGIMMADLYLKGGLK